MNNSCPLQLARIEVRRVRVAGYSRNPATAQPGGRCLVSRGLPGHTSAPLCTPYFGSSICMLVHYFLVVKQVFANLGQPEATRRTTVERIAVGWCWTLIRGIGATCALILCVQM